MSFVLVDWLIVILLIILAGVWIVDIFVNLRKDPWIWSGGKFKMVSPYDKSEHRYVYDTEYDVGPGHKRTLRFMQLFELINGHKQVIVTWTKKDGFIQDPYTNMDKVAWARSIYIINRQYKDFMFHTQRKGKL